VGASHQRTAEGFPGPLPFPSNLLAATAGVVGRRRLSGPVEEVTRGTRREGHPLVGRNVQRRGVLAGKRGVDIGKTKCGLSTKLMVAADGRGVPLGVRLGPASAPEVPLIESTPE
jgi:hypothetical protein